MNAFAKSFALRCALNFFTIFSMQACTLSTPSRYARRYARAFLANLREVEMGLPEITRTVFASRVAVYTIQSGREGFGKIQLHRISSTVGCGH